MSDSTAPRSALRTAAGLVGAEAADAFALLGHETRLAILLAIWDAHDLQADDNAVPFSEIFERVGHDDPGNLRYHLEQLDGQFVHQRTDRGGYELRVPAQRIVQAVIAGVAGILGPIAGGLLWFVVVSMGIGGLARSWLHADFSEVG